MSDKLLTAMRSRGRQVLPEKEKFLLWAEAEINKGLQSMYVCLAADPLGDDVTLHQLVIGDFSEEIYASINGMNEAAKDPNKSRPVLPCELDHPYHWHPVRTKECPGYDEEALRHGTADDDDKPSGTPLKGI